MPGASTRCTAWTELTPIHPLRSMNASVPSDRGILLSNAPTNRSCQPLGAWSHHYPHKLWASARCRLATHKNRQMRDRPLIYAFGANYDAARARRRARSKRSSG
jgi:hypothetical protein